MSLVRSDIDPLAGRIPGGLLGVFLFAAAHASASVNGMASGQGPRAGVDFRLNWRGRQRIEGAGLVRPCGKVDRLCLGGS